MDAVGNTDEEQTQDASTLSMFSDEGLDLSQRISESLFIGPDFESDNDFVSGTSLRKLVMFNLAGIVHNYVELEKCLLIL